MIYMLTEKFNRYQTGGLGYQTMQINHKHVFTKYNNN